MALARSESKEDLVVDNPKIIIKNRDNISAYHRVVTVEPCILLYFLGIMAMYPLTDQYVLHTIQLQHNFTQNNKACIKNFSDPNYIKEQDYQAEASRMSMIFTITTLLPALLITTQLGGYSGSVGRKIPMLLVLVGTALRCLISFLIVYFELPLQLLNIGCLFEGLSGGTSAFLMACFAYIADITTHSDRSIRIYILEIAIGVGIVLSSIGLGYLIKMLGYMWPFAILGGIHLANILYTLLVLRESVEKQPSAKFFTLVHYKQIWQLYFSNDGTNRRWKLLLSLLILFLVCIPNIGGASVLVLFQLDSPICFDSVDIGLFSAARYFIVSVSGVLTVKFFIAKFGDTGLMIVGGITGAIYYTWVAFITSKLVMFLCTLSAVCSTLPVPCIRSFSSKIVKPEEQGVMFSAVANVQSLAIPVATVILNSIYSATLKPPNFKGTTFLVQGGIFCLAVVLTILLIVGLKRERRQNSEDDNSADKVTA